MRAASVGASEAILVSRGRLEAGTWPQVVPVDFDDRPQVDGRRASPFRTRAAYRIADIE